MQKITPFLWFNGNAEEAVNFYAAVFEHAKVGKISRYSDAGPFPKGTVMTAEVELFGQKFIALNGGPAIQIHASHLVFRQLRDTGRGRSLLVAAHGRRHGTALRLAGR